MAVLTSLPGITVSVLTINSEDPLTEYPDDEDNAEVAAHLRHKTTTNYIQSEPGVPFSFKLNVGPPYLHDCQMLAFVFVLNGVDDGPAQLCSPENMEEDGTYEEIVPGWEVADDEGKCVLRNFRFTELKTNDEIPSRRRGDIEMMKKVGTIEVRVYRHKNTREKKGPNKKKLQKAIKEVPEKIIKGQAVSHSIELGEGEELEEETIWSYQAFMDGEGHPVGVFRFKCRAKADLQKMFIIPRSPSPVPTPPPEPPSFEELDDEEARVEYVELNGGPQVKVEVPRRAQAANVVAGQKRKKSFKESRREDGKLIFEINNDEDEVQAPAPAVAAPIVEDDDDVVFVSSNRVRKTRAERENAARPRMKNED